MPHTATNARFQDPDAYASGIHHCHASIRPTARGAFEGRLILARLPEFSLCLAGEALARHAVLWLPPDRVFFRFVAPQDAPRRRSGLVDLPGTIMVSPGRGSIEDITTGPAISRSLSMPLHMLLARTSGLFDDQPALHQKAAPLRPPPTTLARLLQVHHDMLHAAIHDSGGKRSLVMQEALWDLLAEALTAAAPARDKGLPRRSQAMLARLAEFIRANEDRPISLGELCAVAGCSSKTLETLFRRALGETPNRYLRRWRMWRVREALSTADPAATTVSEVAVAYGFWELGRFAVAYRAAFGESPSQTLRGRQGRAAVRADLALTNTA
jgi:AraC-like DNA-binding protein